MEVWEDEDFEPKPPALKKEQSKGLWDDEDADDQNVKESWEDDEDVIQVKPPKEEPPVQKSVSKSADKATGKKGKQPEAKSTKVVEKEALADPAAEKLRQQRLVEESDYKATKELFGSNGDEKSLDNFIPKSEDDFLEYAELLSHKIRPFEKSFHYIGLLKAIMRHSMTSLKAADAKEIASSVSAIANEKLKQEKEANAGKKKGAKKKQLHVGKPDDDIVTGSYDDAGDDFDFM